MTKFWVSTAMRLAFLLSLGTPPSVFAVSDEASDGGRQLLSLSEARQYMVTLINRDREKCGLSPVTLDDLANKAGQLHADDMAVVGYLSHWDSSGRKPDQRYTELGGKDFVMENCHMEFSGYSEDESGKAKAKLVENPRFDKDTLEKIEAGFFNEQPPHDGHRKNILDSHHNRVGIGLSIAAFGESQRMTCTQEFVNSYFKLADIPRKVSRGDTFVVAGKVPEGLKLHGIDAYWEEPPKPMTVKELERTQSYGPPVTRIQSFFPAPSAVTPSISMTGDGQEFSLSLPIDSATWKPGLCYVYVWAKRGDAGSKEMFLVSSRTVVIE